MDNSGLNTGLLIVIVVVLVAGAVWYFTSQEQNQPDANIEVTLPGSGGNNE